MIQVKNKLKPIKKITKLKNNFDQKSEIYLLVDLALKSKKSLLNSNSIVIQMMNHSIMQRLVWIL